jgi:hypothetical protein
MIQDIDHFPQRHIREARIKINDRNLIRANISLMARPVVMLVDHKGTLFFIDVLKITSQIARCFIKMYNI